MRAISRLLLVISLASLIALSCIPGEADALPYKVQGYLRDENGVPITLANISFTGEVYDMGVQDMVQKTWYRETNQYGYFVIHLAANEPGGMFMNSSLVVSYDSGEGVATTTVNIEGLGTWANLTYTESPEIYDMITSPAGMIIIVLAVSAVVIGYFVYRSGKHQEPPAEEKPGKVERRRSRK